MERTARIYVAGHRGMVGSAIVRALAARGAARPDAHAGGAGSHRPGGRRGVLRGRAADSRLFAAELTGLTAEVTGYAGRIAWDESKPDGTPRKVMDSARIRAFGWRPRTGLREGLTKMYGRYLATGGRRTA